MDLTMQRILNEMELQGKQQIELGEHLGVTANIITDWKSGRLKSYRKYLHGIADFLGVSVEYLRGETDQKEKPPIVSDERLQELYNNVKDLSDAEFLAFKAFVAGLKANRPQD